MKGVHWTISLHCGMVSTCTKPVVCSLLLNTFYKLELTDLVPRGACESEACDCCNKSSCITQNRPVLLESKGLILESTLCV